MLLTGWRQTKACYIPSLMTITSSTPVIHSYPYLDNLKGAFEFKIYCFGYKFSPDQRELPRETSIDTLECKNDVFIA